MESGRFLTDGADITIGIGFVPDWVRIRATNGADEERMEWSRNMDGDYGAVHGMEIDDDGAITQRGDALDSAGVGITPVLGGGSALTAASTTQLVRLAAQDQRGSGTGNDVTIWTLTTAGNATGKFDAAISTTYFGVGSRICIDGTWYVCRALSNDGDADDDVTLNAAAASGDVDFIGPMYDFMDAPAGTIMPAGFKLDASSTIGALSVPAYFEAGKYL